LAASSFRANSVVRPPMPSALCDLIPTFSPSYLLNFILPPLVRCSKISVTCRSNRHPFFAPR
jgi:hypothetical protein